MIGQSRKPNGTPCLRVGQSDIFQQVIGQLSQLAILPLVAEMGENRLCGQPEQAGTRGSLGQRKGAEEVCSQHCIGFLYGGRFSGRPLNEVIRLRRVPGEMTAIGRT